LATATRWISAFRVRIPSTSHGGLTSPALGAGRTFVGEKTICAMHERAFPGAAGVSPPWRVIQWAIAKIEHCSPTRERTNKSGGCQPAVGMSNAVATVSVHRPPTGRLCATIAVLPLQTRFSNHGWLTSAAPDCPRADCRRKAVAICNGVLFPTGAYAPRSWCSANVCRRKNDLCDVETHIPRSGGRQPAVGMSNAVAIADAFVQRPASACRWSETTVATATRWNSAFQVRIPRTSHGGLTPPALGAVRTFVGEKTICAM
jgi:hypothetical protein